MKKKPKVSKREQKRLDLIDRWENTPAENPLYKGKTPAEVARILLQPKKQQCPEPVHFPV